MKVYVLFQESKKTVLRYAVEEVNLKRIGPNGNGMERIIFIIGTRTESIVLGSKRTSESMGYGSISGASVVIVLKTYWIVAGLDHGIALGILTGAENTVQFFGLNFE
jgi:hypothetical protein